MGKLRAKLIVSFRAKVLFPMLAVMFVLLAVTVWVLDQRITQQMETEARRTLAGADRLFRSRQEARMKELLARFRILSRQPIYRGVFGRRDAPTILDSLNAVLRDANVDVVMFTPDEEETSPLFQKQNDLLISMSAFEAASARAVRAALERTEVVDTIRVGERLYDVVSIPVFSREEVGRSDTPLIGALTLGTEVGRSVAAELRTETQSEIV
ncbi:MAG: hypothetical protein HY300_11960, partial [Verrucomicrobia bacterium]|nr:hypothetical protein [Verrucomicrobiota bacterium]